MKKIDNLKVDVKSYPTDLCNYQTSHFDLSQNPNECENKSEYTEKSEFDYQNSTFIEISTKFKGKKKSEI